MSVAERGALSSATLSNVASSTSSVTLAAADGNRQFLAVFNDSSADLFVKYGATASSTSFTVKVAAGGYWEMPEPTFRGRVDGIWSAANGFARVTEGA